VSEGTGAQGLRRLREWLLSPNVDEQALARALNSATERQPPPVLWLLGKAQSGKTSVIRALTGSSRAEIGNGFQPCTRTASFYDFPSEAPVVRFLDTRGLGEVAYDASEDLAYCEAQSNLLVAVMKVTDLHQESVVDALRAVRRRHPDWPILVLQTALHEAYPVGADHPQPWPFDQAPLPTSVPADLRRLLSEQRQLLSGLPGSGAVYWVPVDLTLPEDGFNTEFYGLEALWQGIEQVSTIELRGRLQADSEVRDTFSRAAHPHIMGYTMAAGGAGALPLVDAALLPALQVKLLHTLGSIYGQPWNTRTASEFLGLLGVGVAAGFGIRWAGRSLVKLVPGWGQTVGAAWGASGSAAVTFALGKAACYYLGRKREGLPVDEQAIRRVYADAFMRGTGLRSGEDGSGSS